MTITLPVRTIPVLSVMFGALIASYVALIIATVLMAAWQTNLASSLDTTQTAISALETRYYQSVSDIDATDPATLGLAKPAKVTYVQESGRSFALTYAGR